MMLWERNYLAELKLAKRTKKKDDTALQGRFQTIIHNDIKVTVLNYAFSNHDEAWELTNYFNLWISRQSPKSVRLLVDLEKAHYDSIHSNHLKKTLGIHGTFIKKSAIINLSPFLTSMLSTMRNFTDFIGIPLKNERGIFFKDKATALDWLVK
jgi:hypothetical protein